MTIIKKTFKKFLIENDEEGWKKEDFKSTGSTINSGKFVKKTGDKVHSEFRKYYDTDNRIEREIFELIANAFYNRFGLKTSSLEKAEKITFKDKSGENNIIGGLKSPWMGNIEKIDNNKLNNLLSPPEEKETEDDEGEDRKQLRMVKQLLSMKDIDSPNKIPFKLSLKEKINIYQQYLKLEGEEIVDQVPQLNEIEQKFAESFNAFTAEIEDIEDTSEKLLSDYKFIGKNPSILNAAKKYASEHFAEMNNILRNININKDTKSLMIPLIKDLFSAYYMDNSILRDDIVVTRVTKDNPWLSDKLAGDLVVETAFFSTSLNLDTILLQFTDGYGDSEGYIYNIYIPKGSRALFLGEYSDFTEEKELLMFPGSVFLILKIENIKNVSNVRIELQHGFIYSLLYLGSIGTTVINSIKDN